MSGSVEKLQQNLDALQTAIDTLQPIVDELSENSAIAIVDDIVYGHCASPFYSENPSFTPQNLADLKGRPFLTFNGYSVELRVDNRLASDGYSQVQIVEYVAEGNVYAGFGDGKIHTITYSSYEESYGITSKALSNGDFIFNKADGNLYVYDANNHAFVGLGTKQHYVVDYIIDYVGYELPTTSSNPMALFLKISQDYNGCSLFQNNVYDNSYDDFSFANIQSILSNQPEIYAVENDRNSVRAIHDLLNGDTIYCKSNNCSYTFVNNNGVKSFQAITEGSYTTVVNDIIWGVYNESVQNPSYPVNLKAMRGRPYLYIDTSYYSYPVLSVVNFFSSGQLLARSDIGELESAASYAAFYDGKIYVIDDKGIISSKPLSNGDFIFNKADNSLYTYDAQNHKFVQEGNHHYVVDLIIDYVNATTTDSKFDNLPNGAEEGVLILKAYSGYWAEIYCYFNEGEDVWFSADVGLNEETYFANIRSGLNDEACIYEYIAVGGGNTVIKVIHELREGDTFYNKADGCNYMLSVNGNSKSFVRTSEPVIPPVQDILHIGSKLPTQYTADDKYMLYQPDETNFSGYLFTALSDSDWGYGTKIDDGKFYASLDNHKLYSFNGWGGKVFMPVTIPTGVPFLNKADNCLYVFDGSTFVKTNNS